ncbi:MAG TPA: hypothetical protein DDW17_10000 [Deltaproteobacteria bacterium]|nr:hypothetical protein [Deltaproteobacteria bacterium]
MPDIFPNTVLYILFDERINNIHDKNANAHQTQNIQDPSSHNTGRVGSPSKAYAQGAFMQVFLGGVGKTAWPSAVPGSNGEVFMTGTVTLAGQNGVTVTHNKGDTNYVVKVMPKDVGIFGLVGDIAIVKAANTCVIYNSGIGNIAADIELSNIA